MEVIWKADSKGRWYLHPDYNRELAEPYGEARFRVEVDRQVRKAWKKFNKRMRKHLKKQHAEA